LGFWRSGPEALNLRFAWPRFRNGVAVRRSPLQEKVELAVVLGKIQKIQGLKPLL